MFCFVFWPSTGRWRRNEESFVKKSSVEPFHEERNYHGLVKTFCEIFRATEVMQCPTKLLKGSNVNTGYIIFSSSPVNIPSYSPQKYTFVFVQKKKFLQTAKLFLQGILTAWKHFEKEMKALKKVQCALIISTLHDLLVK